MEVMVEKSLFKHDLIVIEMHYFGLDRISYTLSVKKDLTKKKKKDFTIKD